MKPPTFRPPPFPILVVACLLLVGLTACSSGGLGDIFGKSPNSPPPATDVAEVRGTVEFVDANGGFIELERVSTRSNLQNDGGEDFRLYFYSDTRVTYDGDVYRPGDLERGDQVIARVEEENGRWYASQDIQVSYDSTTNSSGQTADNDGGLDDDPWNDDRDQGDQADAAFLGTVVSIDTRERTIELERDSSRFSTGREDDVVLLHYDSRTRVLYQGNYYEPENIERGDEIRVEAERVQNQWVAEDIEVVGNVRSTRGN